MWQFFPLALVLSKFGEAAKASIRAAFGGKIELVQINGKPVEATHYRLVSDLTVDLWYDDQNRWVQLSFEARGQKIDYRLSRLY